jgi:hypothetical protein
MYKPAVEVKGQFNKTTFYNLFFPLSKLTRFFVKNKGVQEDYINVCLQLAYSGHGSTFCLLY